MSLVLFVFSPTNTKADIRNGTDSISKILGQSPDSSKLDLLIKSADEYNNTNTDQSLEYANIAITIAKKLSNHKKQLSAEIIIGKTYFIKGNYTKAINQLEKTLLLAHSINDSIHLIDIYQVYSLIYTKLGDFKKALEFSQNAFSLIGKLNQQSKLADIVRETGNIYFSFGESPVALDFYQKSLTISKENNNQIGVSKALNNIGRIYSELGEFSKALDYLNKSLEIKYKDDNKLGLANTLLNIGTIYFRQENYTTAIQYFLKANSYYSQVPFIEGVSNSFQYVGRSYLKLKNYKQAEAFFNTAKVLANNAKIKTLLVEISLRESELYAEINSYKRAYESLFKFKELRDSVFSDEQRNLLMELDAKYNLQAKEKRILLLSKEQELKDAQKNKLIFWNAFLIIAALFLIFSIYFIHNRMRFRAKINKKLIEEINQRKIIEEELQGHQEHLEAVVEDRTLALKIAKDKAEESDMLKTAFLANLSHEIRTPMNAIVGFANLLVDSEATDTDKKDFVRLIHSNSETLMHLINDIIDISIIESGQIKINKTPVFIFEVLEDLLFFFNQEKHKINKSHIAITLDYDLSLTFHSILTDKNRLRQVMSNLLSNALKFTNQGSIVFGFKLTDPQTVTFFVKDTGIGILPENQASIFERFSKYNRQNDSIILPGTGLGLALCKELIHLMNGNIWFNSQPNSGSSFYFTLPNIDYDSSISESQQTKESNIELDLSNKTIIVAEDVTSNFMLIKAYLKRTNVNLLWAKDGKEVIRMLENSDVNLILLDIQMPIMDGLKTIEVIRATGNKIPIIIQTAFVLSGEIEKCFSLGCNDYLTKPISKDDLINKVSLFI
ncbi:MAG: tetratricopeptide repeat protein [Bacteroidales bacterium]|nr:tetratricopeptide repeat protein [Bacteroidales bacterium]